MTPAEHLKWCKERALQYADRGDLTGAAASMASDMLKHPETAKSCVPALMMLGAMDAARGDAIGVRRWIEGFR